MLLSDSRRRTVIATVCALIGFFLMHEVTIRDSRYAARQAALREDTDPPSPGAKLRFTATAYCKGTITASGVGVRRGVVAADPDLLPVGSVIAIDSLGATYNGIYTVMDTGPLVQGRKLDLYMWSCHDALKFGRQHVRVTILRLGWHPRRSAPNSLPKF